LGPVEYVENRIQCIGAGGICGEQDKVHWGRCNMWRTGSSAMGPVQYVENSIQCIGAGSICAAHHTVLSDLHLSFFVSPNTNLRQHVV